MSPLNFTRRQLFVAAVVVLLAALFFLRQCGSRDAAIPKSTQRTADSLAVTEKPYDARMDSLSRLTKAASVNVALAVRARDSALSVAQRSSARADSLAALAARTDSATEPSALDTAVYYANLAYDAAVHWHDAYLARTDEVGQLYAVIAADSVGLAAAHQLSAGDSARADLATRRAGALEELNKQLQRDFTAASRCDLVRVARFAVPCPTRLQTFVGGAIIGTVGVLLIRR